MESNGWREITTQKWANKPSFNIIEPVNFAYNMPPIDIVEIRELMDRQIPGISRVSGAP
jgi:hypothetical protein